MEDTTENTPWTSITAYYKGFPVKVSVPSNKSPEAIKTTIEGFISAGFEPSWNKDTTNTQLGRTGTSKATTEPQEGTPTCGIHGVFMVRRPAGISKTTGKKYPAFWACPEKNADGSYCRYKPEEDDINF